jgi:hypothetical protein
MVMFWVSVLAISMLLYLLLDGFDLGVGMLFGLTRSEASRTIMLRTIAPFWDGNETWLIVTAVVLWSAFPVVYATLLSALYIPVVIMLAGLVLRGVSFEFRNEAQRRWIWDLCFGCGSLAASFMQGVMVRALFRVRTSWRLLARQEIRWPDQGQCASCDPSLRNSSIGVPACRLLTRAYQTPSDHAPMDRPAISSRLPGHRWRRGVGPRSQHSTSR